MNNPRQDIRAIVFDIGGVLVDLQGVASLTGWMELESSREEIWRLWLSSSAVRDFETGLIEPDEFARRLIVEFRLKVEPDEFLIAFEGWPAGAFAGAAELVSRIPRPITRATLSNSNALHWTRFTAEVGLQHLFDHHFASHLTGKIKPDAEAFENAARVLGCEPSTILFLDDQPINVRAAAESGFRTACVQGVGEAERALIDCGVIGL